MAAIEGTQLENCKGIAMYGFRRSMKLSKFLLVNMQHYFHGIFPPYFYVMRLH